MAITVDVNGVPIQYPQTGDTGWGNNATKFAEEVASVLGKIGQSQAPVNDDIIVSPGNLSVTSGNLSVGGDASITGNTTLTGNITVNGNSNLGNGTSDTTAITGILNVDSGVLYVDPVNNRVGINDTTPSEALDVTGNALISGTLGVTGATSLSSTLGVTGDVAVNTNKFNVTASSGNTTIAGTLGVTGDVAVNTNKFNITASSGNTTVAGTLGVTSDITTSGILTASNSTNVTTAPPITFTGDTNTGIGRSAADTLDFITNGASRFRIESTGQIKAVYESQVGTDYNTQLDNGYLCRAWVNFNGTGTVAIRASGNVSSITDNNTGDYTVNFTTAMPDTNYACCGMSTYRGVVVTFNLNTTSGGVAPATGSVRINSSTASADFDSPLITVGVFR